MADREKIINAIEKAKKQSEDYAQDTIIVPFKEADMILVLLKEREPETMEVCNGELYCPSCGEKLKSYYHYCNECGQAVKWNERPKED